MHTFVNVYVYTYVRKYVKLTRCMYRHIYTHQCVALTPEPAMRSSAPAFAPGSLRMRTRAGLRSLQCRLPNKRGWLYLVGGTTAGNQIQSMFLLQVQIRLLGELFYLCIACAFAYLSRQRAFHDESRTVFQKFESVPCGDIRYTKAWGTSACYTQKRRSTIQHVLGET